MTAAQRPVGPEQNLLFLCSMARMRSPTAAKVFACVPGLQTRFGGLDWGAEREATVEDLTWADEILCMEDRHRTMLGKKFGPLLRGRKPIVLGIPDRFDPMDPELVEILLQKVPAFLKVPVDAQAVRACLKANGWDDTVKPPAPYCW
jgi:predicted protein tyrosine phosphatase